MPRALIGVAHDRQTPTDKDMGLFVHQELEPLPLPSSSKVWIRRGVEHERQDCEVECVLTLCSSLEALDIQTFGNIGESNFLEWIGALYGKSTS